jgi:CheY-like chemotaxis protein
MTSSASHPDTRILVIDDHAISRHFTITALKQLAVTVRQARTGNEAITIARSCLPGLIFTDINLPDSCGLAVIAEIKKAWPPDQALPRFIIVTGDRSSRLRRRINQAGIDEILLKPVPMQDIVSSALRIIQMDTSVQEKSVQSPAATIDYELGKLFSQELITRLPALDEYISQLKWKPAAELLHQLIASSALCQEQDLEFCCRKLYRAISRKPCPEAIAQTYHQFLQAAAQIKLRM